VPWCVVCVERARVRVQRMEKVKKQRNVWFLNPSADAYVSHFWCCASMVVGGWLRRDIFRTATFLGETKVRDSRVDHHNVV